VAAGGTVDYWVAGLVPASSGTGFFFSQDQWFFLAQSGSSTGWTQMTLPSPSLVAFRRNSATSATEVLDIPLGFAQADVSPFKVQVHFGYRTSKTNVFVNKGVIWDSAK
jgi:hypothetical protein